VWDLTEEVSSDGTAAALIQPVDPDDETPCQWCADVLSASVYGNSLDDLATMVVSFAGGPVFQATRLVNAHQIGQFTLVEQAPGFDGLEVVGAAFEFNRGGGRLFINWGDLVAKLHLNKNQNGPYWFHKRRARWVELSTKLGGTSGCARQNIPYDQRQHEREPDRCLEFPSVSLRLLLIQCIRHARAPSERQGRLSDASDQAAFGRIYTSLMCKLPRNFTFVIRCDWQAKKVGTVHVGRCPVTINVVDTAVGLSEIAAAVQAEKVPTMRLWENQMQRILRMGGQVLTDFTASMHNEAAKEHSELISSIFGQ
ncbi:unnamed protein product, partial [Prorocentrum cordatum]